MKRRSRRLGRVMRWGSVAACIAYTLLVVISWGGKSEFEARLETRSKMQSLQLRFEGARLLVTGYRVDRSAQGERTTIDVSFRSTAFEDDESFIHKRLKLMETKMSEAERQELRERRRRENRNNMEQRRAEAVIDFYLVQGGGDSDAFAYHSSSGAFAVFVPVYIPGLLLVGCAFLICRRLPVKRSLQPCETCGYELDGLPSDTCPECGITITHA